MLIKMTNALEYIKTTNAFASHIWDECAEVEFA